MRTALLALVVLFLVLVPLSVWLTEGSGSVDGIPTGGPVVLGVTIALSIMSWSAFSWTSKRFSLSGVLLCVITGASLVLPFLSVLGPFAGIIVGIVAGFSASRLQRRMEDPSQNRQLKLAVMTLVAAYIGLTAVALGASSPHIWDTGDGIGAWTGTPEGMEQQVLPFDLVGLVPLLASATSLGATVLLIRVRK